MCVTVRTLRLLVSSVPVILSVARVVRCTWWFTRDAIPFKSFRSLTKWPSCRCLITIYGSGTVIRFGDAAGEVPHLPTDLPPDEEVRKAYLMPYSFIVGCIKNRPLHLIMETVSRD